MIGLIFAIIELVATLLYAFLKITGLWASLIIIILSMLFHTYIMPISDNVAELIIYISLIPSGILFIRNIFVILHNIMVWIKNLIH